MNKQEYLDTLRAALETKNAANVDGMIEYYDEMICDRMEDGMSEEDAVAALPAVHKVVEDAMLDMPIHKLATARVRESREKAEKKGHGAIWIVLAVLGFPIWFPLAITLITLVLVFMLVLFIFVGVLYIVDISIGASALAVLLGGLSFTLGVFTFPGFLTGLGGALVLGAICILLIKPLNIVAKAVARFCGAVLIGIKKMFI